MSVIFLRLSTASLGTRRRRSSAVVQALSNYRKRHQSDPIRNIDLIFPTQVGMPLGPGDVSGRVREFLTRNQLPQMRFHEMGHTAGSIKLKNHVAMCTVSGILGHAIITTTVDICGHVEEEAFDQAAAAMRRALG